LYLKSKSQHVECNDKLVNINEKGNKNLNRKPFKRPR